MKLKRIQGFALLALSGSMAALNINDINIPAIIEQIKGTIERTPQINEVATTLGRELDSLPYASLGFTKDDIERLVRGDVSQNLATLLKSRLNVTDADLAALRQGTVTTDLRDRLVQEAQKGLALLRRVVPQVRNIETVIELIKSPILTKIVRPENLTPEFKAAAEKAIAFANQNKEFVASVKDKVAQIVTIIIQMLNTEFTTVQSIPTTVAGLGALLTKIETAIRPSVQALVTDIQRLDRGQLQDIFTAFKNVDYRKIDSDGIKKDFMEFRASLAL
jgi:hypothetical protein